MLQGKQSSNELFFFFVLFTLITKVTPKLILVIPYIYSMKEENVYVELTWEELETVLSALRAIKNMVDNDRLDEVYVKLSTQYKGV